MVTETRIVFKINCKKQKNSLFVFKIQGCICQTFPKNGLPGNTKHTHDVFGASSQRVFLEISTVFQK